MPGGGRHAHHGRLPARTGTGVAERDLPGADDRAAEVSPATAVGGLAGRLAEPVHGLARQMLDSPLMSVDTRPIGEFPRAAAGPAHRLRRQPRSSWPGWPRPRTWWWCRPSTGRAGRRRTSGPPGRSPRRSPRRSAATWSTSSALQFLDPAAALRSLPDEQGRIRLVDWVLVPYSSDADGLWFTTKGLRRFGLLELQTQGVPDHLTRAWGAVMTGAARRLLRDWTDGLSRRGGARRSCSCRCWPRSPGTTSRWRTAIRSSTAATAPVLLRLELDPATDPEADSFLSLRPPAGHPGPAGRYFAAACATLFAGIQPDVRYARPDDAMSRAIATARAGLGDIRARFLAGRLPAETQLVVKYGLPGDDGPEFVWAGRHLLGHPGADRRRQRQRRRHRPDGAHRRPGGGRGRPTSSTGPCSTPPASSRAAGPRPSSTPANAPAAADPPATHAASGARDAGAPHRGRARTGAGRRASAARRPRTSTSTSSPSARPGGGVEQGQRDALPCGSGRRCRW